jgi:hypothetical protein
MLRARHPLLSRLPLARAAAVVSREPSRLVSSGPGAAAPPPPPPSRGDELVLQRMLAATDPATRTGRDVFEGIDAPATCSPATSSDPAAGGSGLCPNPVEVDDATFAEESESVLEEMAAGAVEEGFLVSWPDPDTLAISAPPCSRSSGGGAGVRGAVTVRRSLLRRQLMLECPSGNFAYAFVPQTREWRFVAGDGHELRDAVVRAIAEVGGHSLA